jgi:malonyl CoA-acyl carrier protein transacylase
MSAANTTVIMPSNTLAVRDGKMPPDTPLRSTDGTTGRVGLTEIPLFSELADEKLPAPPKRANDGLSVGIYQIKPVKNCKHL